MRSRDEIKGFLWSVRNEKCSMVELAKKFAEFAHDGQVDKAGKAYMGHINRVAGLADKRYGNVYLTATAYLHDTVEDGGFTISDLTAYFPTVVCKLVNILTRKKSEERGPYIEAIANNYLAIKVKLADLTDNMNLERITTPTQKDYERQDRYNAEYRRLFDALIEMERSIPESDLDPLVYERFYME